MPPGYICIIVNTNLSCKRREALDLLAGRVVSGRIPLRLRVWGRKIKLDPLNPEVRDGDPLYLQVERRIEDRLLRGLYKAGDRIPPRPSW